MRSKLCTAVASYFKRTPDRNIYTEKVRAVWNMSETDLGFGFKVVFLGNSGVGKTAAVQRFCLGKFPDTHAKTLTSQFYERSFELTDSADLIDVMIWDTPGRENLHLLAADSFQNANIGVIFYSFTDRASFEAVPQWVEKIKAVSPSVQVVLVENKVDCLDHGQITFDEAQRMSSQLEAPLFRVSVREGLNLRNLFTYLAVTLNSRFLSSLNSLPLGADAFFVANVDDNDDEKVVAESKAPTSVAGDQGDQNGMCNVA